MTSRHQTAICYLGIRWPGSRTTGRDTVPMNPYVTIYVRPLRSSRPLKHDTSSSGQWKRNSQGEYGNLTSPLISQHYSGRIYTLVFTQSRHLKSKQVSSMPSLEILLPPRQLRIAFSFGLPLVSHIIGVFSVPGTAIVPFSCNMNGSITLRCCYFHGTALQITDFASPGDSSRTQQMGEGARLRSSGSYFVPHLAQVPGCL